MSSNKIIIKGARVHNLKNIDVEIPRDKFVVITGLSGSGKSSLAFDTIYAEGQRRYVESLSAYARQFLGLMDKPDVDQIEGLSPAISIDQKSTSHNPRSTVGTITEVYDYLRLLFARIGKPHCPECDKEIKSQTVQQIGDKILKMPGGTKIWLVAPVIKDKKGEHKHVFEEFQKSGYGRVRVDGKLYSIEEALDMNLDKQKKHKIEVVVDRLEVDSADKKRLVESLEKTDDLGDGIIIAHLPDSKKDLIYSKHLSCPECDISLPKFEPRNFSFNSPHGACDDCSGLGTKLEVDPDLIIPNKKLSLAEGAIRPWSRTASNQTWYYRMLENVAKAHKFSTRVPVSKLTKKQLDIVLFGTGAKKYNMNYSSDKFSGDFNTSYEGVIPNLERRYRETESDYIRSEIEKYMRIYTCPRCKGRRLKSEALAVTVGEKTINEIATMTIEQAADYFGRINNGKHKENIKLNKRESMIAIQILKEIKGINNRYHSINIAELG